MEIIKVNLLKLLSFSHSHIVCTHGSMTCCVLKGFYLYNTSVWHHRSYLYIVQTPGYLSRSMLMSMMCWWPYS